MASSEKSPGSKLEEGGQVGRVEANRGNDEANFPYIRGRQMRTLSTERLNISNTAYGGELALKERELEAAAIKMGHEKRTNSGKHLMSWMQRKHLFHLQGKRQHHRKQSAEWCNVDLLAY